MDETEILNSCNLTYNTTLLIWIGKIMEMGVAFPSFLSSLRYRSNVLKSNWRRETECVSVQLSVFN